MYDRAEIRPFGGMAVKGWTRPRCYSRRHMNSKILSLIAAGLLANSASAQLPNIPDYVPVVVNQRADAVYPTHLEEIGVKSGSASIAVAVDEQGQLADMLVTAYSNRAFADSALAAIRKWTFEPARIHGIPRNTKSDITFRFQLEGVVVVTLTNLSYSEMLHLKLAPGSTAYAACTLSELDRIPTPTKIVSPAYQESLAKSSRGGHVAVSFYIDEEGHVRMPSVSRATDEENEELAAIAVTAVSQWQFDPPISKGKPVLVVAEQDFNFKPSAPQGSAPGAHAG
ncbi:MAG TPA: TonB family protein [Opitutaceae bacterium]|jgi:TonB family protein